MNTKSESIIMAGLLLATPVSTLLSSAPAQARSATALGSLYTSSATFTAVGALGFSRKVKIGVRVVKNGNTGRFHGDRAVVGVCMPAQEPDTVTIEILDAKTGAVLHIADRLFGDIEEGSNTLKKTQSSECTGGKLELDVTGRSATLRVLLENALVLRVGDAGTVTLPANLTLKR